MWKTSRKNLFFFTWFLFFFFFTSSAHAGQLQYVSDLLATSSAPGVATDHVITFQVPQAIPPSGKISIIPETGFFTIPAAFDYADVDVATSSSLNGAYSDRTIGPFASTTVDGISVVSGISGSVEITLNSLFGIATNTFVRIELGITATSTATSSEVADTQIINPSGIRSYAISIFTKDASGAVLDSQNAMVAIVPTIGLSIRPIDEDPPIRFNGIPSGSIPAGVTTVLFSLKTNEYAICKYDTVASTSYASMANSFSSDLQLFHESSVSVSDGNSYTFYVRCIDNNNNINQDDFVISFSIAVPTDGGGGEGGGGGETGGGEAGGGGGGGGGGTPGGSGGGIGGGSGGGIGEGVGEGTDFPAPAGASVITLQGMSYPHSAVTLLVDGVFSKVVVATTQGVFSGTIVLETQGTYTFGVRARDSEGRISTTHNSTITVVGGTHTTLSNIFIAPTQEVNKTVVNPGEPVAVFGESIASTTVESALYAQGDDEESAVTATFLSDVDGKWSNVFDTAGLAIGTYILKSRSLLSEFEKSEFSNSLFIGLGQNPEIDFCPRSDINNDGKINLIDFSIMLFNWGTNDSQSDINANGTVDLTDFSIMLFCWTG